MNDPLRPRSLVHHGWVEAVGMLLLRGAHEAEARRRVLAMWTPGTRVFALGAWYAVMFPAARRVRAEASPGAALVRGPGPTPLTATAPLTPAEQRRLVAQGARPEGLVVVHGGQAEPVTLAASSLVDPAAWIDLDDLVPLTVSPLGLPPPVVVLPATGATVPALRPETPGAIGTALQRTLQALVSRSGSTGLAGLPGGDVGAASAALSQAVRALPPSAEEGADPNAGVALTPTRGWWSRVRNWVQRALLGARVRRLFGAQQARDLQSMIEMFRAGDLDAALRRAIPLGGTAAPDAEPKPVTWDPIAPRARLDIALRPTTHSTGAGGGSLHALLTALYREAAQNLEAAGRFDEAAFVLAELLRVPGEAVALLERHGRFVLAAELAETARLVPELRVRQWMLAGATERVLGILREHQGFAAGLKALEPNPEVAQSLRRLWAWHLASVGDYASARTVGAPVPDLADAVESWGDALMALGGPAAIRVLVERLSEHPDRWESLRPRVEALALAEGHSGLHHRELFATAAQRAPASVALVSAARSLVRPQARDAARTSDPTDLQTLQVLLTVASDPVLRTDLPYWPTFARAPLSARTEPLALVFDPADTGPTPVSDAALLPDGSMLLGLGESGVSLHAPDGTLRRHEDAPCHRLVLSDRADRALLLAARGTSWRVARLVLPDGAASLWGECTLDAFAADYDGDVWVVGQAGEVLALDAQAPRIKALHGPAQTPRTDGTRVLSVARDAARTAAVRRLQRTERWRWRLPGWGLVERTAEPNAEEAMAVHASGAAIRRGDGRGLWLDPGTSQPVVALPCTVGAVSAVSHLALPWVVLVESTPEATTVVAWHQTAARTVLTVRLEGARRAWGRVCDEALVVCDDRGRAVAIHLRTGQVLHDLRV